MGFIPATTGTVLPPSILPYRSACRTKPESESNHRHLGFQHEQCVPHFFIAQQRNHDAPKPVIKKLSTPASLFSKFVSFYSLYYYTVLLCGSFLPDLPRRQLHTPHEVFFLPPARLSTRHRVLSSAVNSAACFSRCRICCGFGMCVFPRRADGALVLVHDGDVDVALLFE